MASRARSPAVKEIKRVVLNQEGEAIVPWPAGVQYEPQPDLPWAERTGISGMHEHCCGQLRLRAVSERFNVLHCLKCYLRIHISENIKTVAQLRQYLRYRGVEQPPPEE